MASRPTARPENKVSLGLVKGINNRIRVLQRRAHFGGGLEQFHFRR